MWATERGESLSMADEGAPLLVARAASFDELPASYQ